MSLKKGQLYEGYVTDYKFPNQGKVDTDDGSAYVKDTLPGQKVSFYVTRKSSGTSKGRLCEVIERSSLETEDPGCDQFGMCGGCTYRRLKYEEQLTLKAGLVKDMLSKVYDDFEFEGISSSPAVDGYRNKMEFTFGDEKKDGPFSLGMHRKGSFYDVVNVDGCRIVSEDINTVKNAVRDYFGKYYEAGQIDFHNNMSHRGYLRHLLVRQSQANGDMLIALITTTPSESDKIEDDSELIAGYTAMLKELNLNGRIAGAFHVYNNALSDVVKSDETVRLFGQDFITETILGLNFNISLFSFFQTNSKGAEVLYEKARDFAAYTGGGVIYDLYSGTGTIAQLMSPVASEVIGVEIVEEAVEAAKKNAKLNGIENVSFIAGDVMKVLCGEEGDNLPKPDLIILDPPREGIHPKALKKILGYGVERIVYISCKPTSLAEELSEFKAAGYDLKKAACVDMFPHTVHVETVVALRREKVDGYIDVDLDVEKIQGKSGIATYKEIQEYVADKYGGMKVHSAYIGQIKTKAGLNKRKNYNVGEGKHDVKICPKEKEDAIMDAFRHFNLI